MTLARGACAALMATICLVITTAASAPDVRAQAQYPLRPVTIVIPYAKGGPTDKVAQPLVQEMAKALGQPVQLAYMGGEGGTRGPREVLKQGGDDGYRLLLHNIGMASAPTLYRHLGFDPTADYLPIGLIADAPMLLLGRAGLPPANAQELFSYIRANTDTLAVAYGGPGGAGQLCGLMLEAMLRVKLIWVPYTGTGPALNDLQRGRADLLCDQTTHAMGALEAGTIKAYALTMKQRIDVLPDLPTTIEAGVGNVQIAVWHALYAVRGTPPEVIDRLANALQTAVASPTFVAAMTRVGVVPATPEDATPGALRRHLTTEIARWRPLIEKTGQYAD